MILSTAIAGLIVYLIAKNTNNKEVVNEENISDRNR